MQGSQRHQLHFLHSWMTAAPLGTSLAHTLHTPSHGAFKLLVRCFLGHSIERAGGLPDAAPHPLLLLLLLLLLLPLLLLLLLLLLPPLLPPPLLLLLPLLLLKRANALRDDVLAATVAGGGEKWAAPG
jgi:hypothetical protein